MLESLLIYLTITIFVFLLYSVVVKSSINSSVKNFLIFIILGFFSLFIGLRYQVGTDYENYLRAVLEFDPSFINYIQSGELEISVFFIRYVAVLINFPAFFFIMSAFLTLVFVHFAIKKFFVNDNIAFFIYLLTFFPDSLNLVRQMLALSIILLAIGLIKQNKRIAALIAIIFAATFHTTAILAIAFIFLDYRIYAGILKNKYIKIVFLIVVFIGIPALVINLQNIIVFFNNRGLLMNYSRYAQVIQTAEKFNKNLLILEITEFEKRLVTKFIRTNIEDKVSQLIKASDHINEKICNINTFSNLTIKLYSFYLKIGFLRNHKDFELVNSFLYSTLPVFQEEKLSFDEKMYLYNSFVG